MEGTKMRSRSFITKPQAAKVTKPRQRTLDDVAGLAQTAAMRTTARGQQADDQHADHHADNPDETIARVALQGLGLAAPFALAVGQRGELGQHRPDQFLVALVGWPGLDDQGQALRLADQVPFAPFFAAVGGIGAGVRPPKTARTEALSMITRSVSKAPAWVQCCKRRQQVHGLGPISLGNSRQGMPPRKTYKMPSRHWRSSWAGRPPLGWPGRLGNSGWTTLHSSSERSVCMMNLLVAYLHANTPLRF